MNVSHLDLLPAGVLLGVILDSNIRRMLQRRKWQAALDRGETAPPPKGGKVARPLAFSCLFIAVLAWVWWAESRPLEWLGLRLPHGWRGSVGTGLALAYVIVLAVFVRAMVRDARRNSEDRQELEAQVQRVRTQQFGINLNPAFVIVVSVWEELCFRGYVYWLAAAFVGEPLGALLSAALFGLAHFSQGVTVVARTAFLGGIFTAVRWMTGSLWVAMFSHALHNLFISHLVHSVEALPASTKPEAGPSPDATAAANPTSQTEAGGG